MRVIKLAEVIKSECPVLFDHEFRALLEAVRRDLRKEQNAIHEDVPERMQEHTNNVRYAKRVLDVLQPKHPREVIEQNTETNIGDKSMFVVSVELILENEDDKLQQID